MGDPHSRKNQTLNRLRAQLRKKKESLADQFDFKMYIAFVFKDKKKKSALFEVAEVVPVMTNDYEENILKGVRESSYSLDSSIELLQKDVVQLHAPRYQSMRRDVIGCTQEMDFILWPRNDIEKVVCLLFSKWKGADGEPFRPVQAKFEFHHGDYEKQFLHLLSRKDKAGLIVNNPTQSIFLFINRQHLQILEGRPISFTTLEVRRKIAVWNTDNNVSAMMQHCRARIPGKDLKMCLNGNIPTTAYDEETVEGGLSLWKQKRGDGKK